jgi:putative transferase (TIGR04331 family)
MDIRTLEERYLERARGVVSGRAREIDAVLPDRLPAPGEYDLSLVGWWARETDCVGRVILPNPYETVEAIATMDAWVWSVVERIGPRLGERLDVLAGVPLRPATYWRTVLAPWLVHLLSALADRRLFCRAAADLVPDAPLLVPGRPEPPATTAAAVWSLRSDAGNARLLATIAPHLGVRTRAAETSVPDADGVAARRPLPTATEVAAAFPRVAVGALLGALPRRRVTLVGHTHLTARDVLRLEARVRGLVPLPRPTLSAPAIAAPPADQTLRARLELGNSEEPLEWLALQAMPDLLPRSLLEGFGEVERASWRRYRRASNVLVGNYGVDEVQNEFLGRCRAAGGRFAFAQHGGFYLQSPANSQERLEIESGSVFLSWGGRAANVRPTPNPHLERLRDSHRGGSRITVVEALEPPDAYVIRFAATPLANQTYETGQLLAEMVDHLSTARRARLALKRFPNPIGTPSRPAVLERLPTDGPAGGAAAWLRLSRLAVIPYLDTPFIESIVIGTPTVGLWNPAHWALRDDVEPLFERLREVGIVHADARAAAVHIDDVYDDVERWWRRADVTRARAEFIERFAVPGDWLKAWTDRLCDLGG